MTPPLVPSILPSLDAIRAIPGSLGLRPWTVKVRVRTWSGSTVGAGTKSDVDTTLTCQSALGGTQNIKVRQLTTREIVSSAGLYRDKDIVVGPITPSYAAAYSLAAGGFGDATVDPAIGTSPTEVFWNVSGPASPTGGAWCTKIGETDVTAMHYCIVLRASAAVP